MKLPLGRKRSKPAKAFLYLVVWFFCGASVHFYIHFMLTNIPAVPFHRVIAGFMYDLAFGSVFCILAMLLHHFVQHLLAKTMLLSLLTLLYLWAVINALHIQYFSVFVSYINVREFFNFPQLGFGFLWSSLLAPPFLLFFVLPWCLSGIGILLVKRPFPLRSYFLVALMGLFALVYANGESGGFSSNPKIFSSYNYLYQSLFHIKPADFSPTEEDIAALLDFFQKPAFDKKAAWYPLLEAYVNEKNPFPFPNIILLILESMGSHCIDAEITPHLFQFQQESLYYKNYYSPIRTTNAALFALQTSLLTPRIYTTPRYAHVAYQNLPMILKENGFSNYHFDAAELHKSQKKFYEKNGNVQSWGGRAMMQAIDNSAVPSDPDAEVIAPDVVLYQFFFKKRAALESPYYAILSPMSTHSPYVLGKNHQPVYSDQVTDAYHYSDRQFGKFLAQFKADPAFKNTILFVTSDTSPGCFYKKSTTAHDQLMDALRVPFHIYYQTLPQPQVIHQMGSHLDLAPTLLDYLGISYQTAFLGKSLLKEPQRSQILFIKTAMRGWVDQNQCILAETQDRDISYQCTQGAIPLSSERKKQYQKTLRILDTLEYLNINNRISLRQ